MAALLKEVTAPREYLMREPRRAGHPADKVFFFFFRSPFGHRVVPGEQPQRNGLLKLQEELPSLFLRLERRITSVNVGSENSAPDWAWHADPSCKRHRGMAPHRRDLMA